MRLAIGFGVTCDPPEEISERLTIDDLADVELEGTVECARGPLSVAGFSRLAEGATLKLDTSLAAPGLLRFGDVLFGQGVCGIRSGHTAIVLAVETARAAA